MFRNLLRWLAVPLLVFLSNSSGNSAAQGASEGIFVGPDIITGDIGSIAGEGMEQFGSDGTQVGPLAIRETCRWIFSRYQQRTILSFRSTCTE